MIINHVEKLCSALMNSIPEPQGLSWSPPQDMAAWSEFYFTRLAQGAH